MEVDVEHCPFRAKQQKQALHILSNFVAHFMLKKIGARGSRQGEIKFLAPKIYLLANTHTLTHNAILQITLLFNVHTHAQGYSRSLRSQIIVKCSNFALYTWLLDPQFFPSTVSPRNPRVSNSFRLQISQPMTCSSHDQDLTPSALW
jgi:hypothetical protein